MLAPAFDFGGNRLRQLGEHGIDEWRRSGVLRVFHYGYGEHRDVGYALYEDAGAYDAFDLKLSHPTLIVHGRRDETCDPAMVERWAHHRPNVDLHMVDDGHQLTDSMPYIWEKARTIFGLSETGA